MEEKELIQEILKLKQEKNAIILVHNYQRPEMYQIADFIGDSLELCRKAMATKAEIIVFCGVDFMAESAKLLNPEKKVLLPNLKAKCPMAAMIGASEVKRLREKHQVPVVCYVNTSAEVKAEADICCTSANALEIVSSFEGDVILVPDKHLAEYVAYKTGKRIHSNNGYCYVHDKITAEFIRKAKENHPEAEVIAHPECSLEVIKMADHVCSTSGMAKYAESSPAKEFIIASEGGMVDLLSLKVPGKTFYSSNQLCFNQKAITLEDVKRALIKEEYEVVLDPSIMKRAWKSLERMIRHNG